MSSLTPEEERELINLLHLTPYDYLHQTKWFFLNSEYTKKVMLSYFEYAVNQAWRYNNDLYIINFGREGGGKSLFSLWLAYHFNKKRNKELNVYTNVVFEHIEWLNAQLNLKQDILIYDEAENTFNTMKFQTEEGRQGMETAIRNRSSKIINFLNFPHLKYIHPYIREARTDLLFLNLSYDLSTGRRIFIKALYDKKGLIKLLEEMFKTTFLDKENLFRKKTKKGFILNFKPVVAGIFDITQDLENPEFGKIYQLYDLRKEEYKNLPRVKDLLKSITGEGKLHMLKEFIYKNSLYLKLFMYIIYDLYEDELISRKLTIKEKNGLYFLVPFDIFLLFYPRDWFLIFIEILKKSRFIEGLVYDPQELSVPLSKYFLKIKKEYLDMIGKIYFQEFEVTNIVDKVLYLSLEDLIKKQEKKEIIFEKILERNFPKTLIIKREEFLKKPRILFYEEVKEMIRENKYYNQVSPSSFRPSETFLKFKQIISH